MITVAILINGNPLTARSATRIAKVGNAGTYRCDDGTIIEHDYGKGSVPLAIKMLETIKETEE